MKLIGISGKKRSGKDTVADIIKTIHPRSVKYSFATPLKQEVSIAVSRSIQYIDDNKAVFRPMLQWWGTDFKRNTVDKNYWVDKMAQALEQFERGMFDIVIIPDVRFKNEYDFVKSRGGVLIRVCRPDAQAEDNHPSETELDKEKFDHIIFNNSTVEHLVDEVTQLDL